MSAELRVHGVGGAPGPKHLGTGDPDQVVTLQDWGAVRVLARREDHTVQSFEWGDLTSGAPLHALWVLLLPFTLVNVAGWMQPRSEDEPFGGFAAAMRIATVAISWTVTAAAAMWTIDVLVGLVATGWGWRLLGASGFTLTVAGHSAHLDRPALRVVLVVAGFVLVALLAVALRGLASSSRSIEDAGPGDAAPPGQQPVGPFGPPFYGKARPWHSRSVAHAVIVLGCIAFAVLITVRDWSKVDPGNRLDFDTGLLAVAAIGSTALGLTAIVIAVGAVVGQVRHPHRRGATTALRAIAVCTMALVTVNAYFVSIELLASQFLGTHPSVEGEPSSLPLGRALVITDAIALTLAAWLVVALGVAVVRARRTRVLRRAAPDDPWSGARSSATATAELIHHLDRVLILLAALSAGITVWVLAVRADAGGGGLWGFEAPDPDGTGLRVVAWLVPVAVGAIVAFTRKAATDRTSLRVVAQIWDVLTFWPRWHHPLSVRCYASQAVPRLRGQVRSSLADGVVVSAHSQGSVLAVAALSGCSADELERVALVSYGSPIGPLLSRLFPNYLSAPALAPLGNALRDDRRARWWNFYRTTDPIGGALPDDVVRNVCLEDPSPITKVPSSPPGWEPDRVQTDGLAIHSYYLRERTLKARVRKLRNLLDGQAPDTTEEAP